MDLYTPVITPKRINKTNITAINSSKFLEKIKKTEHIVKKMSIIILIKIFDLVKKIIFKNFFIFFN
jgi:hypothetical protein